jgi:hypothetical protein
MAFGPRNSSLIPPESLEPLNSPLKMFKLQMAIINLLYLWYLLYLFKRRWATAASSATP